jgi:hypothetical protein
MHPFVASHDATRHWSVVVQLLEISVYTHPETVLQVSSVHWSPSLQTVSSLSQDPVVGLQLYCEQALLGGQNTSGVYTHALSLQVSVVQALKSLHRVAIADGLFD